MKMSQQCKEVYETLDILKAYGPLNAMTASRLNKATTFGFWFSHREIRRLIRELVVVHKKPIGSCSKGFFFIQTPKDREIAERKIVADIKALAIRLKVINPRSRIGRALAGQKEIEL